MSQNDRDSSEGSDLKVLGSQSSQDNKVIEQKMSRLKRIILWMLSPLALLLLLMTLLVSATWYLTSTNTGTATLIGFVSDALPDLDIEGVEGSLQNNLAIDRILWENDGIEIEVSDSIAKASTFLPRITIDTLTAKLITITLPLNKEQKKREPFAIVLPDIHLPIDVDLKNVDVEEMHIKQGDALIKLRDVKLSSLIEDDRLILHGLSGELYDDDGDISVNAKGYMGLSNPHPLALKIGIEGDSQRLGVGSLSLSAKGEVVDYQVNANGYWKYANYPEYKLDFKGDGNLEQLQVDQLNLLGEAGEINLAGLTTWSPELNWNLEVSGDSLNPGLFAKEYPGKINMLWISKGRLAEKLSVQLELKKLEGSLQDYPIDADLKLSIEDEDITLKTLRAKVGDNELVATGLAGESVDLQWQLDAPNLTQLHQSIRGYLKGNGRVSGKRDGSKLMVVINQLEGELLDYPVDVKGGFHINHQLISADDLQLNIGSNHLHLNGSADENQGIDWQLDAKELIQLYPEITGKLSGKGNIKGLLDGSRATFQVDHLNGHVQDYPINIEGLIKWQDEVMTAKDLILIVGKNKAKLNGVANDDQGINWEINAQQLNQLHPSVKGDLKGQGNIKGLLDGSMAILQIDGLQGHLQGYPVKAKGYLQLQNQMVTAKDLILEAGDNQIKLNGITNEDEGIEWQVNAENLSQLHPEIKGSVSGMGNLKGLMDGSHGTLHIETLSGNLQGLPIKARGQVHYQDESVTAKEILLEAGDNQFTLNGNTGKDLGIDWAIDAQKIGQLYTGLNASIKGEGKLSGKLDGSAYKVKVNELKGQYEGHPLNVTGLIRSTDGKLSVKDVHVYAGVNHFQVNGKATEPFDLAFKINAPELAEAWPGLGGSLKGSGAFKGSFNEGLHKPQLQADLTGKQLRYQNISVASLGLKASQQDETYTIQAVVKDFKQGENQIQRATLDGKGKLDNHTLNLAVQHKEGKLGLRATGSWKQEQWKGQLKSLALGDTVAGNWRLNHPVHIKASATKVTSTMACLSSNQHAQLCADGKWSAANGVVISSKGQLKKIPLAMAKPWLPDTLDLAGVIDGDFDISMMNGKPIGVLDIRLPDSHIAIKSEMKKGQASNNPSAKAEILYYTNTRAKIILANSPDQAKVTASVDLKGRGQLRVDGRIDLATDIQQSRLNLNTSIKVPDIHWMQEFSNDISELKGHLDADIEMKGTIVKPRITGSVQLKEGAFYLPETGAKIQAVHLSIKTNQADQMVMTGTLTAGQGALHANGHLLMGNLPKWTADLTLKGERLLLMDTYEVQAQVSPDLKIKASPDLIAITGMIKIPETAINLSELPVSAKSRADDIVIVGVDGKTLAKAVDKESMLNIQPDVIIELGDKVSFSGLGFKSRFTGRLHILKSKQDIITQGNLNLIDGIFQAYGQHLEIERGRLIFGGSVDNPGLDIRAIRRVPNDILVGISLRGTAQMPESELFSEPLQTETDTLTYLLTGLPASEATSGDSALLSSAISGLGISGGDTMAQKMGNQLGLDDVGISSSTGNYLDSELTIGKKVGAKLYVRYIVGLFNSLQKVAVTYKINQRLEAEMLTGGKQQKLDLNYKIETNRGIFGP